MGMDLSQKTIAVIGGTGFVGRAIVEKLAATGARILILARNAERAKSVKVFGAVGQISAVAGNALNDDELAAVIEPADMVVNLIGILAPSGRQKFEALQAELPGRIGKMAAVKGVTNIVHLSAIGASLKSPSLYARTKAEGERALLRQFPSAIVLRPSVIFGPGDGLFARFGQMAMFAPALPLVGGGRNRMQPVYVGNVADSVVAALKGMATHGQIYQLGGPHIYSFAELMRFILKATERRRMLVSVPFSLMAIPTFFAGLLPNPPVTSDQLKLLKTDNICAKSAPGLAELGITPTAIEAIVPEYLAAFRPGGRFTYR
jgi:NADH dehydrogenase